MTVRREVQEALDAMFKRLMVGPQSQSGTTPEAIQARLRIVDECSQQISDGERDYILVRLLGVALTAWWQAVSAGSGLPGYSERLDEFRDLNEASIRAITAEQFDEITREIDDPERGCSS